LSCLGNYLGIAPNKALSYSCVDFFHLHWF
jgi:hypothetical protein